MMRRRLVGRAAGCAALVLLGACATGAGSAGAPPTPAATIEQLYARALADAAVYEERDVLPLHPAVADGDGRVRVVTLTSDSIATGRQTLREDTWVTVVPEVRDSCSGWDDADLVMRLRQLLGLRPTESVSYFIEMEAPAVHMFRPAVDPSIFTRTPCSAEQARRPGCGLSFPASVDSVHIAWMAGQMLSAWKMPDGYPRSDADPDQLGYPWTRLGYTYNWHPGSPRYGASEYLVRAGAQVLVSGSHSIPAYCGRA